MYKVFVEEKAFYLTFNVSESLISDNFKIIREEYASNALSNIKQHDDVMVFNFFNHKRLKRFLKKNYKVISAAGGVVENDKGEILMIFRNGFWDLPKGKIEKGEKKKQAAIREVEEECGITNLIITKGIKTTYHVYPYKGRLALKESFWYAMRYVGKETLIPQIEEGIELVEWVPKKDVPKKLVNTYGNIKDVLEVYFKG